MDFYQIKERSIKNGIVEIYPDFKICRSKDLMVRGRSFYAIWDEEKGLWSTDEYDVQRLVDKDLMAYKEALANKADSIAIVKLMSDFSSKSWAEFRKYLSNISDNSHQLDTQLIFSNDEVKKKDYVSKRLSYPLQSGIYDSFEEIMSTLYDPEERAKLEWAIGSIVSGDSKDIQKFIVLYGEAGTGKSTVLNIIQKLFDGYYTSFEAKGLTSMSNAFATEVFKTNPLVGIQHDGDLSKIEDNTKLNSIVAHEEMTMNEKYKPAYTAATNCFLFIGTNRPVKITDAKSGIIRRLIDVRPSGRKIPNKHYHILMSQIDFELGAIASHCLNVYREMGKNYYSGYRPLDMILQTDVFFNFVEMNYYLFKEQNGISLSQAYEMYKQYCDESLLEFKTPRYKFREELKNYFENFSDAARIDGIQVRSYYSGFLTDKFISVKGLKEEVPYSLVLDSEVSILDNICANYPAQYASDKNIPSKKWAEVNTILADINTKETHYLKLPENHIVIDFDLKNVDGSKDSEKNIEAASKWPNTYAEFSMSGAGLHLHYIYDGDVNKISRVFEEGIEIKIFTGNSSLRRRLSKCNRTQIANINSGLPLKGESMINFETVKSEKGLRDFIKRNLRKEIHDSTKPSIDFIYKILEDAYNSGLPYDVNDMHDVILAFANNSTNQSDYCVKLVTKMKFNSDTVSDSIDDYKKKELVFFDVEVFPNLLVVVWKVEGKAPVKMINPGPKDIEYMLSFKLVGFNCRRYDNHILYARYIGYDNEQLFKLSQKLIKGTYGGMFGEAYNISYTDIYDFSSEKKSLKKFEIDLGIHHQELGFEWDKPVSEEKWGMVADYCANDVIASETVFNSKERKQDFAARLIISELSGLTPNDTTQTHTAKIIFGNDPNPQDKFVYSDLSELFPGYVFDHGVSSYRGENPSEGGYVYAEPGMYTNVAVLDIGSMHPTSLITMNMFGPYTKNFAELVSARLAIKRKDFKAARKMLNGVLAPYLKEENDATDLAFALKIIINIVYGLTSASFSNKFNDPRNVDNIVAKRGALFMIDLKHAVQEKGFKVAHIKTDSIKIPEATPQIIDFIQKFGKGYGYIFEHESTYLKLCLVNDAVFVSKDQNNNWSVVGAQFAKPYVFKTLFSHEKLEFNDFCETKAVSTALYLDLNEGLPEDEHAYHFIGKVSAFCPILPGKGGGVLLREKDGKYNAVTGTKGYRWLESEMVKILNKENDIDHSYYKALVDDAIISISRYCDFEWFVSNDGTKSKEVPLENLPWALPCSEEFYKDCKDCSNCSVHDCEKKPYSCALGYDISNVLLEGE